MRSHALISLLLAGLVVSMNSGPTAFTASTAGAVSRYTNAELGFSYTPPSGLRDLTAAIKESEAARPRNGKPRFESLLRMMSSPDDKAMDWTTLGITTYPRGRDKDKGDDLTASFITNNAVGGGTTIKREVTRIAGGDFATTHFQKVEPPLTKYAVVYTTVRKEKFISFFFSGNDRERVLKLAESMNSVRFQP